MTCKIRVFPKVEQTLAYARMIERCGCSVLAVHGRTREQKDNRATRADWSQIKAVKQVRAREGRGTWCRVGRTQELTHQQGRRVHTAEAHGEIEGVRLR